MKPSEIRAGGRVYQVQYTPLLLGTHLCGQTNFRQQTVSIDESYPEGQQRETVLHEIMHLVSNHYTGEYGLTEHQVGQMCEGLWQVLRDNAGLAEWIWFGEKNDEIP